MPAKPWTTDAQYAFLEEHMDDYRERMIDQSYGSFWDSLYEDWEKAYPERVATFPDLPPSVILSHQQQADLGKAIKTRRSVRKGFNHQKLKCLIYILATFLMVLLAHSEASSKGRDEEG